MTLKQKFAALFLAATLPFQMNAQKWFTRDGAVSFDATAKSSPEEIKAKTSAAAVVLSQDDGRMEVSVLVKGFYFEKALMQEHFNENYLESSKYPKATFKGKIDDLSKIAFDKDGAYQITVSGNMTMHGTTKAMSAPATLTVKGDKVSFSSAFSVLMSDYNIDIPSLVSDKISKEAKIKVEGTLAKLK